MQPRRKKKPKNRKGRAKRRSLRSRLVGAAFLSVMICIDGYALLPVIEHWRMHEDVRIYLDTTGVLAALTAAAFFFVVLD